MPCTRPRGFISSSYPPLICARRVIRRGAACGCIGGTPSAPADGHVNEPAQVAFARGGPNGASRAYAARCAHELGRVSECRTLGAASRTDCAAATWLLVCLWAKVRFPPAVNAIRVDIGMICLSRWAEVCVARCLHLVYPRYTEFTG